MMAPHLVEQEIQQDKVENIEKEINVRVPEGVDPPVRLVCCENKGPTAKQSAKMAELIDPFNQAIPNECWVASTKEFLAWIVKFNNEMNKEIIYFLMMKRHYFHQYSLISLS